MTNYCEKKYDMFGLSSLFFFIPFIHSMIVLENKWDYKIFLLILPIISYLCNTNYNNIITYCDHTTTFFIFISYLIIVNDESYATTLLLLYILEMMTLYQCHYSLMLGYIVIIYSIMIRLPLNQKYILLTCAALAVFSYLRRDCYRPSYVRYTLVWHICNTAILCFGTNTMICL